MSRRAVRSPRPPRRGVTLMEILIVITIMGVLVAIVAPSYQRTVELARADLAAGHLRSLWIAERIWRLDHADYTDEVTLATAGLFDPTLAATTDPYDYQVTHADSTSFTARAVRRGTTWTGSLEIDESGAVDGVIYRDGVPTIKPGYLFREN